MADSSITKKALASALKALMETMPLSKISVGDICERCEMNRKSFYYHFKDKEDLVNWIFDTEYSEYTLNQKSVSQTGALDTLVHYFYDNRAFYRRVLRVEGQNSFSEHFAELIYPILSKRLEQILGPSRTVEGQANFIIDGLIGGLKRWISDQDCDPPEVILDNIESTIYLLAKHACDKIDAEK